MSAAARGIPAKVTPRTSSLTSRRITGSRCALARGVITGHKRAVKQRSSPITTANASGDAKIKVIGCGGGGGNAVNRMVNSGLMGVEFWSLNTDAQALVQSQAPNRLQIGKTATKGLGTGGNAELGEIAAKESRAEIAAAVAGADLVFVTAGMGGGTAERQRPGRVFRGFSRGPRGARGVEAILENPEIIREAIDLLRQNDKNAAAVTHHVPPLRLPILVLRRDVLPRP